MDKNITLISTFKLYPQKHKFYEYLLIKGYSINEIFYKASAENMIFSKKKWIKIWLLSFIQLAINVKKFRKPTIVSGLHYPFFLLAYLFQTIDKNIIIENFYIHENGNNIFLKKLLLFLLKKKHFTFIVQSSSELQYFKTLAPNATITFIPYCLGDVPLNNNSHILPKSLPYKYIFTGGYTNRDYELVLRVARKIPTSNFIIVMSKNNKPLKNTPKNVTVYYDLPVDEFHYLLSKSYCVLVPLKNEVGSSGQMLALAAMKFSKPVIYAINSSINHYFKYNNGIPYKQNDVDSLFNSINDLLNLEEKKIQELGKFQFSIYKKHFTPDQRNLQLIKIVETISNQKG